MTSEFDLPCSACGGSLREVAVKPQALGIQGTTESTILVAECQSCGERHYPEQTLEYLGQHASRTSC